MLLVNDIIKDYAGYLLAASHIRQQIRFTIIGLMVYVDNKSSSDFTTNDIFCNVVTLIQRYGMRDIF